MTTIMAFQVNSDPQTSGVDYDYDHFMANVLMMKGPEDHDHHTDHLVHFHSHCFEAEKSRRRLTAITIITNNSAITTTKATNIIQ